MSRPKVSIIVIFYDMAREAPRTLRSLAVGYQHAVNADDYEVIAIDNGSPQPLDEQMVRDFGPNFHYHYISGAKPSPASAINHGARLSRGEIIGVMIDGARIATPGIVGQTIRAFRAFEDPVVATLGWHLGPEQQQVSVSKGYSKEKEDRLLESINFPYEGYRLFEIGSLGGSSKRGALAAPHESNCVFVHKETFERIGGFDERFDIPGGGLVNLDFFKRACERPEAELVMLISEGTFHQLHGGASTNTTLEDNQKNFARYNEQYRALRGEGWTGVNKPVIAFGRLAREAMPSIAAASAIEAEINRIVQLYRRTDDAQNT